MGGETPGSHLVRGHRRRIGKWKPGGASQLVLGIEASLAQFQFEASLERVSMLGCVLLCLKAAGASSSTTALSVNKAVRDPFLWFCITPAGSSRKLRVPITWTLLWGRSSSPKSPMLDEGPSQNMRQYCREKFKNLTKARLPKQGISACITVETPCLPVWSCQVGPQHACSKHHRSPWKNRAAPMTLQRAVV